MSRVSPSGPPRGGSEGTFLLERRTDDHSHLLDVNGLGGPRRSQWPSVEFLPVQDIPVSVVTYSFPIFPVR